MSFKNGKAKDVSGTWATKGVIMHPTLPMELHTPKPMDLIVVGNTCNVG